jgi:DNA polymerase-3 subunit delta'
MAQRITDFGQFLGNTHLVNVLRRAAEPDSRTLGHAYLLHGTAGTGKRTLATVFAAALLCRGENRPCGECPACKKVFGHGHPDFLRFARPEGKTQFPVDLIREIKRQVYIRPNESDHKVILIENAEEMNAAAANALLKVLEEPPAYLVFILTCSNLSALPETIPSRCICLETHEVTARRAEQWLLRQYPDAGPDRLEKALLCGGGNLGSCLGYLEDETTAALFDQALALCRALAGGREFDLVTRLAPFEGNRDQFSALLPMMDRLVGEIAKSAYLPDCSPELLAFSSRISPERAIRVHTLHGELRKGLKANVGLSLLLAVYTSGLKTIMES